MKTREKKGKQEVRSKQESKGVKQESKGMKHESRGARRQAEAAAAEARERAKRSGIEAVKLHLEVTGGTGRTSRSATSVRLHLNTFF